MIKQDDIKVLGGSGIVGVEAGDSAVDGFVVFTPLITGGGTPLTVPKTSVVGVQKSIDLNTDEDLLKALKARGVKQRVIAEVFGKSEGWVSMKLTGYTPKPKADLDVLGDPIDEWEIWENAPTSKPSVLNSKLWETWDDVQVVPDVNYVGHLAKLWDLLAEESGGNLGAAQQLLETKFASETFEVDDGDGRGADAGYITLNYSTLDRDGGTPTIRVGDVIKYSDDTSASGFKPLTFVYRA